MAFKFKIVKRAVKVDLPSFPSNQSDTEPEDLIGEVQGKKASAPEERMAKALDNAGIQYIFRYVAGAPKGLPGWKELDFLVASDGMLNAVEVDTAFTHRNKQQSDVLHDAIILNDRDIREMGDIYPQVRHVDGESDLASQKNADAYVKRTFTRSPATFGRANTYNPPDISAPANMTTAPTSQAQVQAARKAPQVNRKQLKNQRKTKPQTGNKSMNRKADRMEK